jgi:NAD+ synthase (glutamine-hydrolysing)
VTAVTMPSKFNSRETHGDAKRLAHNLGIELLDIAIQPVYDVFLKTLDPYFKNTAANMAEENIQARIRGTLLMALSNKFGWLVLTTGNKSEMSTGYCTLYGDTAGGFAVLKDVLKTTVYALSKRINEKAGRDIIPLSTIERRPTAELKADQFDEDSLGAYRDLDPLIVDYVEKNKAPGNNAYAKKIISMIDRSEYKRRQAPPGIKITPRSFGRDHRMPITNRYSPR